jgi:putative flippase GtrA
MTDRADLARRVGRFVKFCVVGGAGVFVNLGVANLALWAWPGGEVSATGLLVANTLGIVVSIFSNFMLNDRWTWGDRVKGGRGAWFARLGRYYASCSVAALVQVLAAQGVLTWMSGQANLANLTISGYNVAANVAVLIGIVCGVAVNFPVSHLWAFKDDEHADASA